MKINKDKYKGRPELAIACGVVEASILYWLKTGFIPQPTVQIGKRKFWTVEQFNQIVAKVTPRSIKGAK